MDVPPEIAFRHIEPTDAIKAKILDKIDELEEIYPGLVSCRVMVEDESPGRTSGKMFNVRLDISIPHHDVVVSRQRSDEPAGQELTQVINDAFARAKRQIKEQKARQSGDVKTRDLPPHGRVVRLLADETGERYGFLMSRDGQEIYFHENALVELDYDDLEVGTEVRYAREQGEEGPQASTVAPLDRDKIGPEQEEEVPLKSAHG